MVMGWLEDRWEDAKGVGSGIADVASSAWNVVEDVVTPVARTVYEATPIDNIGRAYTAARQGDWGEFAKQAGIGALEAGLMIIPGGAAARTAYGGARLAGQTALRSGGSAALQGMRGAVVGSPGKAWMSIAPNNPLTRIATSTPGRVAAIGAGFLGAPVIASLPVRAGFNMAFGGGGDEQTVPLPGVSPYAVGGSTVTPEQESIWGEGYTALGDAYRESGGTGNYGLGSGPDTALGDAIYGSQWNEDGGGSESMPIDSTLGPTAEMLYQYALNSSQLQEDYDRQLAEAEAVRRMASMGAQQGLRGLGAQRAGLEASTRAAMGESGLGLSPALQAAAIDEPAAEFARQRGQVMTDWAADRERAIRNRLMAERGYYTGLDRLDAAMAEALAQMARERQFEMYGASGELLS